MKSGHSWGTAVIRRRAVLAAGLAATLALGAGPARPAAASSRGASISSLPANETEFRTTIPPWTSHSYNPYGAAGYLSGFENGFDYVQIPLAYVRLLPGKGRYGGFYRELASGWSTSGRTLTINLRPTAKWNNGTPFTSKDVLVSMEVAGAELNGLWGSIANASAPSPHRLVIDLVPGGVAENVLLDLTQMPIVPASQYKQFAPAGTERNILTYWHLEDPFHPTAASEAAASKSAAAKALAKISAKLPKYNPKTLLGDGPYKLVSVSTNALLLKKWNGFWDAKKFTIPYIYVDALDTASQYGALLSGRLDYVNDTSFTDLQASKLNSVGQRRYVTVKAPINQFALMFNQKHYPFNLRGVRQAMAYIIDRNKFNLLNWQGKFLQNPTADLQDGIPDALNGLYLSSSQQKSLNHYKYNPRKAAALLNGLGFTKRNGTWYTPKGKPFKVTIDAPSGNDNNFDADAIILANMMKQFGIQASSDVIESTTFGTDQAAGDYTASMGLFTSGFVNPLEFYDYTFVSEAKPYGIPAAANVPGLGNVPIGSTINREVATAQPKQWRKLVWDWARYVTREVPAVGLDDNSFHEQYATDRWSDWPAGSHHSLWTAWAPHPIVFQQLGYLKFKKP